jgi:hypothetical protein
MTVHILHLTVSIPAEDMRSARRMQCGSLPRVHDIRVGKEI